MDVRAKVSMALAGLAVFAAAQTGDFYLKDKSGKSSVTGWTSFNAKVLSEDRQSFLIKGNPFTAVWAGQNMTVKARQGDFTALNVSAQTTLIEKATLSGGVTAEATRPSQITGPNLVQTVTIETATLTYTAENERFTFPARVTIDQVDKPAGQTFTVDGSSGWLDLQPSGSPAREKQAVKGIRLEGPVTFELHSLTLVKDPQDPKKKVKRPVVIKGKGRLLTYDDASRKLTLEGDVVIEGTHPSIIGEMKALRAVLTLDANWNPVEIDMSGEPGQTRFAPPPTGAKR